MNTVWTLVYEYQFDDGDNCIFTFVFNSKEDGIDQYKKYCNECKSDFEERFGEDSVDTDEIVGSNCFSYCVYELDNYCYNHANIIFKEQQVQSKTEEA